MLSTARFEAPQTRTRLGFGLLVVFLVNCWMISIRVCVFPVPVPLCKLTHLYNGYCTHLEGRVYRLPRVIPNRTAQRFSGYRLSLRRRK